MRATPQGPAHRKIRPTIIPDSATEDRFRGLGPDKRRSATPPRRVFCYFKVEGVVICEKIAVATEQFLLSLSRPLPLLFAPIARIHATDPRTNFRYLPNPLTDRTAEGRPYGDYRPTLKVFRGTSDSLTGRSSYCGVIQTDRLRSLICFPSGI